MDEREMKRDAEPEQEPREEEKRLEDLETEEGQAADVKAGVRARRTYER